MPFVIVPIIEGAILTGLAATGIGAVIAPSAAAITFLAQGIVTVGAFAATQLASNALQRSLTPESSLSGQTGATALAALNAPDVKLSVKQAAPMQRKVYGPDRVGGPIVFYKVKPPKLYVQHIYSRRKLSGVVGLNVNGFRLGFSVFSFDTILAPIGVEGQPNYPARMRVCFQSGTLTQGTNPLLRAAYPDLPIDWRLPGIANGVVEYDYGADWDDHLALWGNVQIPDMQPDVLGAPVYDPRIPSHWLPSDPDNIEEWFAAQESWAYSSNAALLQADQIWQRDGLNAGPGAVRWDKIAEGAARAEESCLTRDQVFEKRYVAGGVIALDQEPATAFDGLLTASRASMIQGNDGTVWVSHDAPKTPVLTITDDMLRGAVAYRGYKSQRDLPNQTTMRFTAPGRNGQLSDGPPLIRADLIAADGSRMALTVDLPFTSSPSTAQRIAKADLGEARLERTWSGVVDLRSLGVREDDCVEVCSTVCPHWNGLYVVDSWNMSINVKAGSLIGLNLVGYDPANSNDWDADSDDKPVDLTDTDELLAD